MSVGALLSLGTGEGGDGFYANIGNDGFHANVAGELAAAFGDFRVLAQGGYVLGVHGDTTEDRAPYVRAAATYYVNPGFSVSANAGWSRLTDTEDPDFLETTYTFGARTEIALGETPISVFGTYQGYRLTTTDWDNWLFTDHRFGLGFRLVLGADSIQALDAAVPFGDLNPIYGDDNAAH